MVRVCSYLDWKLPEAGLIPGSVLTPKVPRVCPAWSAFSQGDWLLNLPDIQGQAIPSRGDVAANSQLPNAGS